MPFAPEIPPNVPGDAKPDTLLNVPVGLASPLWGLFAGAAMSGAAWWWMTRWARPENLEAMFGAAGAVVEPETTPFAPPPAEPAEPAEAALAAETVVEALAEAPLPAAPVGGESAPISPVVEMLAPEAAAGPAPRSRKKAAEIEADDKPV